MRHQRFAIFALIAISALFVINGCSSNTARVEVGLNANNQQLLAVDAKGHLPAEDWLQVKGTQDWSLTRDYYLKKAREATTPEDSQVWLDLANQVVGQGSTLVKLINASNYRIVVLDGPSAGEMLEPGEASNAEARVPVGTLIFTVGWGNNQRATIVRQIVAGQKTVVIVNK